MIRDEAFEPGPPAEPRGPIRSTGGVRWDPLLSADEESDLASRIKTGDEAARRRLILANLRVVVEIARRFRRGKVPLDDLIQEGNLGLIRASADFDPSVHACRFYTYAEVWIRAFIHRALIANDSLIRVPQHVFLQRKQYRRVGHARASGVDVEGTGEAGSAGAEPSTRGLGDIAPRLDPDDFSEIRHSPLPSVVGEEEGVPLTEAIIDDRQPDQQVADYERRLILELALRRLNPVEAWIIRERYGLCLLIPGERDWSIPRFHAAHPENPASESDADDDSHADGRAFFHRSYIELARDCGLSRHRIRQVEEAALEKLRHVLLAGLA